MLRSRSFKKSFALFACLPVSLALASACNGKDDGGADASTQGSGGDGSAGEGSGGRNSGTGGAGLGGEVGTGGDPTTGGQTGTGGKKGTGGSASSTGGQNGSGSQNGSGGQDSTGGLGGEGGEDGGPNPDDIDGDGTPNELDVDADGDGLIEVSTLEQLDWMRNSVDGTTRSDGTTWNSTGCSASLPGGSLPRCFGYELTADLDFDTNASGTTDAGDAYFDPEGDGGNRGWRPIKNFSATFQGNGHHISNLYVNRPDEINVGFIGYMDESSYSIGLRDVTFDGPLTKVVGNANVGLVVGQIYITDASRTLSVVDVHAEGEVSGTSTYVGGLVGLVDCGQFGGSAYLLVDSTSFEGKVTGLDATGGLFGFVNATSSDSVTIKQSFVHADVLSTSTTATQGTGGLVGVAKASSIPSDPAHVSVYSSFASGSVESKGACVGGLIGRMSTSSSTVDLQNSFTVSSAKAATSVAGMAGCLTAPAGEMNFVPYVSECVALGKITSDGWQHAGIFASPGTNLGMQNLYWARDTTGQTEIVPFQGTDDDVVGGIVGATLSQLACPTGPANTTCVASRTLFDDFDTDVWDFGSNTELPGLILNGVVYRPMYDAGTQTFSVTSTVGSP